jgi:hypothetical protein
MKRVLVVLALLVVAASAFAVSGKIYMRYGTSGPLFSYWGDPKNNVDLWQGKDGTGFDVNTESIGITYRTRQSYVMPYGLIAYDYTDTEIIGGGIKTNTAASSPGYLQFRDIKMGNVAMSVGIAWWQMFGNSYNITTNTNGTTNGGQFARNLTYNRIYLDYKFAVALGDSIVIKQVDWEQMHFEWDAGSLAQGNVGFVSNNYQGGSKFFAHVPLRVMITMDRLNLDISPKFTYHTVTTGYNLTGNSNVVTTMSHWRAGGTIAISYGLSDSLSIYLEPGFFFQTQSTYNTTLGWFGASKGLITNVNGTSSITELPLFAGLKVNVGPGIKMTLGYGINFATKIDINNMTSNTNKTDTAMPRGAFYQFNWAANDPGQEWLPTEFSYYGDSFMDFGFLKFGGDIAFAQNWTLGIFAGVGLNDKWSVWWYNLGSRGQTTTTSATSVTSDYGAQLFSFVNLMNYDNNMYIKYEDDKVAIKATLYGGGTGVNPDNTGAGSGAVAPSTALMGLFGYMDFTIKF